MCVCVCVYIYIYIHISLRTQGIDLQDDQYLFGANVGNPHTTPFYTWLSFFVKMLTYYKILLNLWW